MKHHIVAVGISKHQHGFINNLDFAAIDARELFDLFEGNVAGGGYRKLLLDSEATLAQIRAALGSELANEAKEEDSFTFFYSGHGTTAMTNEEDTLAHYLIPFDATHDFVNTCISIDYLRGILERLPCRAKLVFIDSCFSGSINSKGYTNPNRKAVRQIKSFTNTVLGVGSVTFTACKDTEEAIEDSERRNGLFTGELLAEMTRERSQNQFSIADLFTPVTEKVVKRAQEQFGHTQTPTVNSHLQGVLYLPAFRRRNVVAPQLIGPPRLSELSSTTIAVPRISIDDKKLESSLNDLIELVYTSGKGAPATHEIAFERFCAQLVKNLRSDWEKLLVKTTPTVEAISASVADFELAAHQIILLGAVLSIFGTQKQVEIYADYTSEILTFGEHRSGSVAILAIPEIVIVGIIYCMGVISLARGKLGPFSGYLSYRVFSHENRPPEPLFLVDHIHYCDALGRDARTVNDHVRKLLESYPWICALTPRAEGCTMDLQLQVNFILTLLLAHKGYRFWPDFGRFYAHRLRKPFLQRLLYDLAFRTEVATLFGMNQKDLLPRMRELLTEIRKQGLAGSGHFWDSVEPNDLMTYEERQALEKTKKSS